VWCASLEEPGSHVTESFEDTNALFAYLLTKLGIEGADGHAPPD